jgi:hypothetical protein
MATICPSECIQGRSITGFLKVHSDQTFKICKWQLYCVCAPIGLWIARQNRIVSLKNDYFIETHDILTGLYFLTTKKALARPSWFEPKDR